MFEGVDTVVLQDQLAFHDVLPIEWEAAAASLPPERLQALDAANITVLQACIAVEEQPAGDKNEELLPLAHELARLDHKLNLVLQLLGRLMPPGVNVGIAPLSFNSLGVSWQGRGTLPGVGTQGLLSVRLRSALPEPLQFALEITSCDQGELAARHLYLSETAAELLQRFCFLKHRKQVAGVRRARP